MKTFLSWFLAGSLLATLAAAQTDSAQLYRRRAIASNTAHRTAEPCTSARPCLPVYVITVGTVGTPQFGVVDLPTGKFHPIGPVNADVGDGLVPSRGTFPSSGAPLLSLGFSGDLWTIDPVTGENRDIGPTGLGSCSTPGAYAPNCALWIGRLDEKLYVTDFAQNLYSLDPATGHATLIGPTGIPPLTVGPFSQNPDGSFNVFTESMFSFHGKLYVLFSTAAVNFETNVLTNLIAGRIYEINTRTGIATPLNVTSPALNTISTIVNVNETLYAFDASDATLAKAVILDLTTGQTTPVSDVPDTGVIAGAVPARPDLRSTGEHE
jgi:hypothetical protein